MSANGRLKPNLVLIICRHYCSNSSDAV